MPKVTSIGGSKLCSKGGKPTRSLLRSWNKSSSKILAELREAVSMFIQIGIKWQPIEIALEPRQWFRSPSSNQTLRFKWKSQMLLWLLPRSKTLLRLARSLVVLRENLKILGSWKKMQMELMFTQIKKTHIKDFQGNSCQEMKCSKWLIIKSSWLRPITPLK